MIERSPWSRKRVSQGEGGAGGRGAGAASRIRAFCARIRAAFNRSPATRELRLPPRRHPDDDVAFRDRRPASWRALALDRPDLLEARGLSIVRRRPS